MASVGKPLYLKLDAIGPFKDLMKAAHGCMDKDTHFAFQVYKDKVVMIYLSKKKDFAFRLTLPASMFETFHCHEDLFDVIEEEDLSSDEDSDSDEDEQKDTAKACSSRSDHLTLVPLDSSMFAGYINNCKLSEALVIFLNPGDNDQLHLRRGTRKFANFKLGDLSLVYTQIPFTVPQTSVCLGLNQEWFSRDIGTDLYGLTKGDSNCEIRIDSNIHQVEFNIQSDGGTLRECVDLPSDVLTCTWNKTDERDYSYVFAKRNLMNVIKFSARTSSLIIHLPVEGGATEHIFGFMPASSHGGEIAITFAPRVDYD